jgi:hypothetical protein
MAPVQPLRVGIRLSNIHSSVQPVGGILWPTYLWTVFFKIDGDSVNVGVDYKLHGKAIVASTPGNHGDLGDNTNPGDVPIPESLGEFRTVLKPIPITPLQGQNTAGVIGCVALLLIQNGTPDEAVAKGHDALNSAVQDQLDKLILTLGIKKPAPTPGDIDAMTQAVGDAVTATITNNVSIWQWLGSLGNEDSKVNSAVFRFSHNDLANADPTGLPLQSSASITVPITSTLSPTIINTWLLTGLIFADPWDFSLRRTLAFLRLNPADGIRTPMSRAGVSSARSWVISTSPTFILQVIAVPGKSH